jgi:hypothetical protein
VSDTIEFRPPSAEDLAWLKALVEKANTGDRAAVAGLGEFLDANPQVWRRVGDMAGHAEAAWVAVIARGDSLIAGSVQREADRLRGDLLGDRPTPAERMLVDQAVVTHLELRHHQARAAAAPGSTPGQASMLAKRLDGAQRRHLAALKTLELVRRLTPISGSVPPPLRVVRPAGSA